MWRVHLGQTALGDQTRRAVAIQCQRGDARLVIVQESALVDGSSLCGALCRSAARYAVQGARRLPPGPRRRPPLLLLLLLFCSRHTRAVAVLGEQVVLGRAEQTEEAVMRAGGGKVVALQPVSTKVVVQQQLVAIERLRQEGRVDVQQRAQARGRVQAGSHVAHALCGESGEVVHGVLDAQHAVQYTATRVEARLGEGGGPHLARLLGQQHAVERVQGAQQFAGAPLRRREEQRQHFAQREM
mmetsp:Transcript_6796/g.17064  ORF Transcript_6796/g.17064 Transcript_6796/m.17064 type:complete len:242 (+) Transcript_6796:707-1432(+)